MLPPFKIKAVEPIFTSTKEEREKKIKACGYNLFLLSSRDVTIDLLTDSGTSAMSDNQWAGIMLGDESYAGSVNFDHLQKSVREILGFPFILPAHQGRGAEQVLDEILVKAGFAVPGNTHFDTTKAHIEHQHGKAIDCTISEAFDPEIEHPFKGNLDLQKLEKALAANKDKIAYVLITVTCNSGGGQPVSMQNIKEVSKLCKKYKVLLFLDAARFAENAYFIKTREASHSNKSITAIVKEMFDYADGCLMSAKKDPFGNIGGFLAMRSEKLYRDLAPICVLREGFPTYGGMAGRDMEAISRGLRECVEENYLAHRVAQSKYLGDELIKRSLPVMKPIGGHAVYIDAKKFFSHIPQENFPGHALSVELYIEGGIRTVEIGTVLAGRNPETGENVYPKLELTRLAIPRRVYMQEHMDYVAQTATKVFERRKKVKGFVFKYEAPVLRHFQSTFRRM